MSLENGNLSRRDFVKTAGAVGIGSILLPLETLSFAEQKSGADESNSKVVPVRPFGKTGAQVSILGLGGAFHWTNLLLMKKALNLGVTYWDTAAVYGNGESERAIGKYFEKFSEDRKKVFLVTKSKSSDPHSLTKSLETSLERMRTTYIDLYFIHDVSNPYNINREAKAWAEVAKTSGKIRFFGLSTHKNMEQCLQVAAKLGWIDGIMFSYNFRNMHTEKMKKVVDKCHSAGIGLTAMKTMATGRWGTEKVTPNEKEQNFFDQFNKKGVTAEQAKLKAVWGDHRIASICSHMTNMRNLLTNASAAMDNKMLSDQDIYNLKQYARKTASNYCTGCAYICEPTINYKVPISNVMRYLMYSRCYGEPERAKLAFNRLPSHTRKRIADIDYRKAELICPQGMQIGQLMREATLELV
jgi:predicted aldo/keto reductase-like oxidoreductase